MRFVPLSVTVLFFSAAAFAGQIREFDFRTIERLGSELARVSQTADRGATTPARKRAKETAIAALRHELFKTHYEYVVLDDPTGHGFLVYALVSVPNKIALCGHFRVTVSGDGEKAERVDALSHGLLFAPGPPSGLPGKKPVIVSVSQAVSNKPLETSVYTSLHDVVLVSVGMLDGTVWGIVMGQIFQMDSKGNAVRRGW